MKVMSDHEIFADIEDCRSTESAERFGNCVSDVPEYPVEGIINRLNQELEDLNMPYLIEDLFRVEEDQYVWTVVPNTQPKMLDMSERIHLDDRGRAVYQLLLKPFKEAKLSFPSTLEGVMDVFKINLEDCWTLYFIAEWLYNINAKMRPQRTQEVKDAVEKLTVSYGE